jgi:GDSL-like Lipase/Acylhydrolase family
MRVLVVGDSMVFGEGVEERERFTDVLEAIQPTWRVDNFGMTGYGPDLMLMALEKVGLLLNPDVVVFSMYTDDFRRVHPYYAGMGFRIPRFNLENGRLVSVPYPQLDGWERMHIIQAMYHLYFKSRTEWKLNRAILDRFLELAELHSFTPVIIFLPGTGDTGTDKRRRLWLREFADGNGTPFLDLSDAIHKAGVREVFISNNWHLNPYGHRIIALELGRFLAERIRSGQLS